MCWLKDFQQLAVWQKAHQLTLLIYQISGTFPKDEQYGLMGQIRRAAISIPANIAEGCGRNSDAELAHFFQTAMGSASEVEYYFILTRDLGFISPPQYEQLNRDLVEVKRMLNAFIQKLRGKR